MSQELWLIGTHPVQTALERHPQRVLELRVVRGDPERRLSALLDTAKRAGIAIQRVDIQSLNKLAGADRHQGIAARFRPLPVLNDGDLPELLKRSDNPLLLILDQVQDPHNLGACLRVAAASGVDAVVVPKDRAAGLTPAVHRASAGTSLMVPLVQVTNLARCMEQLKASGVWIAGAAGEAEQTLYQHDYRGPFAFVLGAEGEGMRKLTREKCDHLIRIPMAAGVESLNVSVAAGVCLFEALRQRQ